ESDTNVADIINTITESGYEAEVASTPDVELQLSGLNCMKCAGKTQKALEEVEGVDDSVVSTTQAKVYGSADAQTLIA
ncbi:cation transporter, partial [Vibrio parahaemolyticus]|nr:cation transporter [Vibrio parahaemolyticus]